MCLPAHSGKCRTLGESAEAQKMQAEAEKEKLVNFIFFKIFIFQDLDISFMANIDSVFGFNWELANNQPHSSPKYARLRKDTNFLDGH